MNITESKLLISTTDLIDFVGRRWVTIEGENTPTLMFISAGYRQFYNRPNVFALDEHLIAASFMLSCPIEVYHRNENGSFKVLHINQHLTGLTRRFCHGGKYYEPAVKDPAEDQQDQTKLQAVESRSVTVHRQAPSSDMWSKPTTITKRYVSTVHSG